MESGPQPITTPDMPPLVLAVPPVSQMGNMALLVSNLWATASRHKQRAVTVEDALRYSGVGRRERDRVAEYYSHMAAFEHPGGAMGREGDPGRLLGRGTMRGRTARVPLDQMGVLCVGLQDCRQYTGELPHDAAVTRLLPRPVPPSHASLAPLSHSRCLLCGPPATLCSLRIVADFRCRASNTLG